MPSLKILYIIARYIKLADVYNSFYSYILAKKYNIKIGKICKNDKSIGTNLNDYFSQYNSIPVKIIDKEDKIIIKGNKINIFYKYDLLNYHYKQIFTNKISIKKISDTPYQYAMIYTSLINDIIKNKETDEDVLIHKIAVKIWLIKENIDIKSDYIITININYGYVHPNDINILNTITNIASADKRFLSRKFKVAKM